ncbi:MAG: hypothetical protein QOD89_2311 [Bradyrhizobium sp.]|jgi:hypothetical protein|nr:hypothetical protein [Bradyrhizobium sp.]
MVLKGVFAAVVCAALLAGSAASAAEGYKPDEFLSLDLSKAALSPKLLGPPAQFEPMRVEAKTDAQSTATRAAAPKAVSATPKAPKTGTVHARTEKPRVPARTKLARRHSNPLDAQASDTRIQVWPCRSGGICDWRR